MSYGNVYVAQVAFGAKDTHTVKVFEEAESYPGTSLIIAYSHCIAHGYAMQLGLNSKNSPWIPAIWPLFRFDPRRAAAGQPGTPARQPRPKISASSYLVNELRFRILEKSDPARYKALQEAAQTEVKNRFEFYQKLASAGSERNGQ